MKYLYLLLLSLFLQPVFAQKTSLSVHLDGGLGSFRGNSAQETTTFSTGGPFCNCPGSKPSSYGSQNSFSYGAGLTLQRQFKSNVLLGLDAAYEVLKTKVTITEVILDDIIYNTEGKNVSYNHFLNFFPHVGYVFNINPEVNIAVAGGADFGIGLDSYHKYSAPDIFKRDYVNTDIIPGFDFRPRLQLKVGYQKLGFSVGYSYGLKNWMAGWDGGNPSAYMKVVRVGVHYALF